jgi:adenylate kinase family enzyme
MSFSVRKIFLMGAPGSFRNENALFLAENFGWRCISTGDLLKKEVMKKSSVGLKI